MEIIKKTKSSDDHSRMYQQQIMSWGVSFLSCYIFSNINYDSDFLIIFF